MKFHKNYINKAIKKTLLPSITAGCLIFSGSLNAANNYLPDIGTAGVAALTLEKERTIGKQVMLQIRGSYPLIYDPVLQEYIENLGYKLISSGTTPLHPFSFFLINDSSINAFAFFGGHVGVHSGLFLAADTEGELASVLAHEIAHVNQRHLARHLEQQMNMQPTTIGATIGSILLAILAPQVGMAALQTTLASNQQMAINFTRQNEAEADRIGMQTLVNAGFNPYAMPNFFKKLAAKHRYNPKPPAFLLTHPLPENRITDAQLRAQMYPVRNYQQDVDFEFAKARVEVRMSTLGAKEVLAKFTNQYLSSTKPTNRTIYGLALAQLSNNNPQAAAKTIEPILKKYPNNLFIIDAITDINVEQGLLKQAEERLTDFYEYMPSNQVVALNYANVLIKQNKLKPAIEVLKNYLYEKPNDLIALDLLEGAYSSANLISFKYAIQAQSYSLRGQYEYAIKFIERAIKATSIKNRIELARLEAQKKIYRQKLLEFKEQ